MPPVIQSSFLNNLIKEVIRVEASDLILTFNCPPIIKTEQKMQKVEGMGNLSDSDLHALFEEIAPKLKQESLSKDLQVDFAYAQDGARFRVNAFFQRGHLSMVLRYVKTAIPTMQELGLPDIVKDLLGNDNGLILMVGPTGSGKSTSMASMVDYVNENFDKHIITIEDPIEYTYENKRSVIEQREIGVDALSFPAALRSALREAPDLILLGEMRDLESISTAITVAETGHLVLSTVHANSAATTVDRVIDIFPAGDKDQIRIQLADILLAVFNQRLVPKADGSGVRLIIEVMVASNAVKNAIRTANNSQLPSIIQTSASEGMYLLDDLLLQALGRGEITPEVALAYANDRAALKKAMT